MTDQFKRQRDEKSALDKANAEIERLKQHRAHTRCPECGNQGVYSNGVALLAERDQLHAKLKACREFLGDVKFKYLTERIEERGR